MPMKCGGPGIRGRYLFSVVSLLCLSLVFSTPALAASPSVSTLDASNITSTSARLNGDLASFGNQSVAARPTLLGTPAVFQDPSSNPAFSVTVANGANLAVVQYSGGDSCGDVIAATLGGASMTVFLTVAGGPAGLFRNSILYRLNPTAGPQTLQMLGANGCNNGYTHAVLFTSYSGVDGTTPFSSAGATQNSVVCNTGTITWTFAAPSSVQYTLVTINTMQDPAGCSNNNGRLQTPGGYTTSWGFSPGTTACDPLTPRQCGEGGVTGGVTVTGVPVEAAGVAYLATPVFINGASGVVPCTSATVHFEYGTDKGLSSSVSTGALVVSSLGVFHDDITGLGTGVHYFRAVAVNSCGTTAGNIRFFSNLAQKGFDAAVVFAFLGTMILVLAGAYWVKKRRAGI